MKPATAKQKDGWQRTHQPIGGALEGAERISFFFFFNDTATTEIYTLSLHDALPISAHVCDDRRHRRRGDRRIRAMGPCVAQRLSGARSEEHTSELQSRENLVCR